MIRKRIVFLIDMQSFYASVEKSANLAIRNKPVGMAGDPERRSGIVLAAFARAQRWGEPGPA